MIHSAKLKAPWGSPGGKTYPIGTTFIVDQRMEDSTWYRYRIPGKEYGFIIFSNKIFKQLTEEEKHIRDLRRRLVEKHISETKDPVLNQEHGEFK